MVTWKSHPDLPGWLIYSDGKIQSRTGNFINPQIGTTGYLTFMGVGKPRKCHKVHIVVCTAFHGPKPLTADCVRHLDGNPLNNMATNLAWGTWVENMADAKRHGTIAKGSQLPQSKADEEMVRSIRKLNAQGIGSRRLERQFPLSRSAIVKIINRETWDWVV